MNLFANTISVSSLGLSHIGVVGDNHFKIPYVRQINVQRRQKSLNSADSVVNFAKEPIFVGVLLLLSTRRNFNCPVDGNSFVKQYLQRLPTEGRGTRRLFN